MIGWGFRRIGAPPGTIGIPGEAPVLRRNRSGHRCTIKKARVIRGPFLWTTTAYLRRVVALFLRVAFLRVAFFLVAFLRVAFFLVAFLRVAFFLATRFLAGVFRFAVLRFTAMRKPSCIKWFPRLTAPAGRTLMESVMK